MTDHDDLREALEHVTETMDLRLMEVAESRVGFAQFVDNMGNLYSQAKAALDAHPAPHVHEWRTFRDSGNGHTKCVTCGVKAPDRDDLREELETLVETWQPEGWDRANCATDLRAILDAHPAPAPSDGCDCVEMCGMGPTCPGGMLAGLPDSGCWRTSPTPAPIADAETQGDFGALISLILGRTAPSAADAILTSGWLAQRDAETWDAGHSTGALDAANSAIWNYPPTPNPYRAQIETPRSES